MRLFKFTSITLACLLSYFAYAQENHSYVQIGFENTASHTFTVRTPSPLQFQPRQRRWLSVKVGEEVMYIKMMKRYPLFVVTPEMNNTIIDISGTAKLRNKGDTETILYLRAPQSQTLPSKTQQKGTYDPSTSRKDPTVNGSWKHYERGITTRGDYGTLTRHPSLHTLILKHKKIAVVPVRVTITDKKMTKSKKNTPEAIAEKEEQFQTDFQHSFYERLVLMKDRDKLSIDVQDVNTTNQLLSENGIESIEDLLEEEPNKIADILGVDALFSANVEILQMMSKGGAIALNLISDRAVTTDRSKVTLTLYDGYSGARIWEVWQRFDNFTPFWKTETLIQTMLQGEVDRYFPYHVRYMRRVQKELAEEVLLEEEPTIPTPPESVEEQVPPPPPPITEGETDTSDEIYTIVQDMPHFPGCEHLEGRERRSCAEKRMLEYLYKSIRYPEIARENKIEGMVVISFVVEKDGSINDAKILRDLGGGCGLEALRLVQAMPKWIPGKQRNQPVRTQFNLPVRFKLEG